MVLRNRGVNEKSYTKLFVSRLKFVRQGSNSSGEGGRLPKFFESQDSKNEGFGVVGCVQGCKTGFEAFL